MKKILRLTSLLFITALVFNSCGNEQDLHEPQAVNKDEQKIVNNEAVSANVTSESATNKYPNMSWWFVYIV
jgi:hypothetical protein